MYKVMFNLKKRFENWFSTVRLNETLITTDWYNLNNIIKVYGKYITSEELLNQINTYEKEYGDDEVQILEPIYSDYEVKEPDEDYFIVCEGHDGAMNYFYKNIFMRIYESEDDNVVKMFIKKDSDTWKFSYNSDGTINFMYPSNQYFHFFTKYETYVHGDLVKGGRYVEGAWNLYVMRYLYKLVKKIKSLTPEMKFNGEYKKII